MTHINWPGLLKLVPRIIKLKTLKRSTLPSPKPISLDQPKWVHTFIFLILNILSLELQALYIVAILIMISQML